MPQVSIPTIKWGKRKQRSQMCEIFTEDGRIVDMELDVLRGCIDDPVTGMAFIIVPENQYTAEDGQWRQILGERSTIPICMIKQHKMQDGDKDDEELNALINQIYHESAEDAKIQQYINAAKSAVWDKLIWIVTIVCGSILLMFAVNYLGGKG